MDAVDGGGGVKEGIPSPPRLAAPARTRASSGLSPPRLAAGDSGLLLAARRRSPAAFAAAGTRLPRRAELPCCFGTGPDVPRSRIVRSVEEKRACEERLGKLVQKLKDEGINMTQWRLGAFQRMLCPTCKGGSNEELSLSVFIRNDGLNATWTCFRANCGWKGNAQPDGISKVYQAKRGTGNETDSGSDQKVKANNIVKTYRKLREEDPSLEPLCDECDHMPNNAPTVGAPSVSGFISSECFKCEEDDTLITETEVPEVESVLHEKSPFLSIKNRFSDYRFSEDGRDTDDELRQEADYVKLCGTISQTPAELQNVSSEITLEITNECDHMPNNALAVGAPSVSGFNSFECFKCEEDDTLITETEVPEVESVLHEKSPFLSGALSTSNSDEKHAALSPTHWFKSSSPDDHSVEEYGTNSSSLMKMEEMVGSGKRKRTTTTPPEAPEEAPLPDVPPEAPKEAPLPDVLPPQGNQTVPRSPENKRTFYPMRRRIKIQDIRRKIKLGTRSRFDAKEWVCPRCAWTNKPQKHLIAFLPPLACECCNFDLLRVDEYEFSFSYADVTVNGFCPIGNIKDQGKSDHCTLYSCSQCLEITERMSKILIGEEPEGTYNEGPILDVKDLLTKTMKMMKRFNINQGILDQTFNYKTSLTTFEVAVSEGIKEDKEQTGALRTVKACGKQFATPNFGTIIQRIADGIPQVAYFLGGKKLHLLKHGQIYKAPKRPEHKNHGKNIVWHAVVLIGGGKRRREYFFDFVNSYNVTFSVRIPIAEPPKNRPWVGGVREGKSKKIPGGIGKVRASDALLWQPLEFVRYPNSNTSKAPWIAYNYCVDPSSFRASHAN